MRRVTMTRGCGDGAERPPRTTTRASPASSTPSGTSATARQVPRGRGAASARRHRTVAHASRRHPAAARRRAVRSSRRVSRARPSGSGGRLRQRLGLRLARPRHASSDPLTALAVARVCDANHRARHGVLQVPLRAPWSWPIGADHASRLRRTVAARRGRGIHRRRFRGGGGGFRGALLRQLDASLGIMRKLWTGARVGEAELGAPWPVAAGGPPILIGSWAGSRWIERAAREFDGWVGSGARSSWRLIAEASRASARSEGRGRPHQRERATRRRRSRGPDGPDDPFNLVGPRSVILERLRHLRELGFDDVVLVPSRHDAALSTGAPRARRLDLGDLQRLADHQAAGEEEEQDGEV